MNENDGSEALARKRYTVISSVRIFGGAMLVFGLAIIANGFMGLPVLAGYVFFAIGVFDFIALPAILSRKWKSQPNK
jgi:hypothetical protein